MNQLSKMARLARFVLICLPWLIGTPETGQAQPSDQRGVIALSGLGAFREPGPNWVLSSDAVADLSKDNFLRPVPGTGVVVNNMHPAGNTHLVTQKEFGDMDLELDFMMSKNANSGVYLQGRYEVQLLDSWTRLDPAFSDCGGIYQRWDESRGEQREGYEGVAPLMNVARAPGLWQHLKVSFQAPRFDDKGHKIENARFKRVYLNGVLVQLEAAVTGPTRSSYYGDEKPLGPLVLQGDHGNVAFRNIRYAPLDTASVEISTDDPILVNPQGKPYLLRSFLNYGEKKLTHVISAGYPNQSNFSYDLKEGALFQIWRGKFLDVTDMWHERGEPQLAKPLGSVIVLSDGPSVAVLPSPAAPWPDSVAFDDFNNKGYVLDENRFPTFEYSYGGIEAKDKISAAQPGSLTRVISITSPPPGLYGRIALAARIESLGNGWYAVGDKSYYLQLDAKYKPLIRQTHSGQEILVPLTKSSSQITYSITW